MKISVYHLKEKPNENRLKKEDISMFKILDEYFYSKSQEYYTKKFSQNNSSNIKTYDINDIFSGLGIKNSSGQNETILGKMSRGVKRSSKKEFFFEVTKKRPDEIFKNDIKYISDHHEDIPPEEVDFFLSVREGLKGNHSLRTYDEFFESVIEKYDKSNNIKNMGSQNDIFDELVIKILSRSLVLKMNIGGVAESSKKKLFSALSEIKSFVIENGVDEKYLENILGFSYIPTFSIQTKNNRTDSSFNKFVLGFIEMFVVTKNALLNFLLSTEN